MHMYLKGFSIEIFVLALSAFTFRVACEDSDRPCFNVNSKTRCYFKPNVSAANWDTAWKTCRELNANLPVILSEDGQKVLIEYLSKCCLGQSVWTAGRYVGSESQWRWQNGQHFSGPEKPSCEFPNNHCVHETQAILTKELKYGARYPNNPYVFICSYPALHCSRPTHESQKSIPWKDDGCLRWTPKYELRPNEARNECLKDGGDLATFSHKEDLDLLRRMSNVTEFPPNKYWIGLQRKWWIWNTTDMSDIKYNLLNDYEAHQNNCLLINKQSKWSRYACSQNKTIICETETRESSSTNEPLAPSVAIGIAIAILTVAIAVVISSIFIRKRSRVAETRPDAGKSTATSLQKIVVEYEEHTYATIDDDLENLQYENIPNPITTHTNVEICDKPVAPYSEPADCDDSTTKRSTAVYSEPYISSSSITPVLKT